MSKIKNIFSETIKNSRGQATIQTEIVLESGISAKASVPQGKSKGSKEVVSLPAQEAVQKIAQVVKPVIINKDFSSQEDFDEFLVQLDGTPNKSNLGGNSILSCSLAFARAVAQEKGLPLYQYIAQIANTKPRLPAFYMNLINGGEHADNNLDWQEHLIVVTAESASVQLQIGKEIFKHLGSKLKQTAKNISYGDEGGYSLDFPDYRGPLELLTETIKEFNYQKKAQLALDIAANSFSKDEGQNYQILGTKISAQELNDIYLTISQEYSLVSIEDPFAENRPEYYATLTQSLENDVLVVGDDLTVTNPTLIEKMIETKAISAVLIKPNQIGTLTETLRAIILGQENNLKIIVSHRSGETMDSFIADLAYGVGAFGLKAGAPGPKERLVKYERVIAIEQKA